MKRKKEEKSVHHKRGNSSAVSSLEEGISHTSKRKKENSFKKFSALLDELFKKENNVTINKEYIEIKMKGLEESKELKEYILCYAPSDPVTSDDITKRYFLDIEKHHDFKKIMKFIFHSYIRVVVHLADANFKNDVDFSPLFNYFFEPFFPVLDDGEEFLENSATAFKSLYSVLFNVLLDTAIDQKNISRLLPTSGLQPETKSSDLKVGQRCLALLFQELNRFRDSYLTRSEHEDEDEDDYQCQCVKEVCTDVLVFFNQWLPIIETPFFLYHQLFSSLATCPDLIFISGITELDTLFNWDDKKNAFYSTIEEIFGEFIGKINNAYKFVEGMSEGETLKNKYQKQLKEVPKRLLYFLEGIFYDYKVAIMKIDVIGSRIKNSEYNPEKNKLSVLNTKLTRFFLEILELIRLKIDPRIMIKFSVGFGNIFHEIVDYINSYNRDLTTLLESRIASINAVLAKLSPSSSSSSSSSRFFSTNNNSNNDDKVVEESSKLEKLGGKKRCAAV